MYCIKCGVELSAGQKLCPICHTAVYHPELDERECPTYPKGEFQSEAFNRRGLLFVLTVLWLFPMLLPMAFELLWHGRVAWSGYVVGGFLLAYVWFVLPFWFRAPNPVVFVPSGFVASLVYLWYIDFSLAGEWFWRFAMPVGLALALIVTAIVTLCRYLSRGRLFIFGGALIALGCWTQLIELLIRVAFSVRFTVTWSLFSAASLFLLGMMLIVIGIVRPLRESLFKIFFIGR